MCSDTACCGCCCCCCWSCCRWRSTRCLGPTSMSASGISSAIGLRPVLPGGGLHISMGNDVGPGVGISSRQLESVSSVCSQHDWDFAPVICHQQSLMKLCDKAVLGLGPSCGHGTESRRYKSCRPSPGVALGQLTISSRSTGADPFLSKSSQSATVRSIRSHLSRFEKAVIPWMSGTTCSEQHKASFPSGRQRPSFQAVLHGDRCLKLNHGLHKQSSLNAGPR